LTTGQSEENPIRPCTPPRSSSPKASSIFERPAANPHFRRRLKPVEAFAKLYDRKTPIAAAEILNDRVVPFYEEHGTGYAGC
jgi:hypothetical protein